MQPRRILPGTRYMVTRRCYQRTLRLRPNDETNDVFRYCMALAALDTGVVIHAVCVMSNHLHIVLTDVEGKLPIFTHLLHLLTAKVMNTLQGQWENLWSAEPAHYLELGDDSDVIAKIAYAATNPVDAGLVESPALWPGLLRIPTSVPTVERVKRHKVFFRLASPCPAELELRIEPPLGVDDLVERVEAAIGARVRKAHAELASKGLSFLGRRRVMRTSFVRRTKSFELKRGIVPKVSAKSIYLRVALLAVHREFLRLYHDAMSRWRGGARSVAFPDGTWWMRVWHGVREISAMPPGADREPLEAPA